MYKKGITSVSLAIIIGSVLALATIVVTLYLASVVGPRMVAINTAKELVKKIEEVCLSSRDVKIEVKLPNHWGLMKTKTFPRVDNLECKGDCICAIECVSAPRGGPQNIARACFSIEADCKISIKTYHTTSKECGTFLAKKSYGYNGEGYLEAYCVRPKWNPCPAGYKLKLSISKQNNDIIIKVVSSSTY